MPIYQYFGHPARFHGKPLFHILSNLKNFGRGRIITRAGFKEDENPSFYRVLFAQPLMDQKNEEGRVIVEKVRNGVKYTEPVDLSKIAPLPDFLLIPKDEENTFCKWSELRDYSVDKDYVSEPKYYAMPPLLKLYMEREMNKEELILLKNLSFFHIIKPMNKRTLMSWREIKLKNIKRLLQDVKVQLTTVMQITLVLTMHMV